MQCTIRPPKALELSQTTWRTHRPQSKSDQHERRPCPLPASPTAPKGRANQVLRPRTALLATDLTCGRQHGRRCPRLLWSALQAVRAPGEVPSRSLPSQAARCWVQTGRHSAANECGVTNTLKQPVFFLHHTGVYSFQVLRRRFVAVVQRSCTTVFFFRHCVFSLMLVLGARLVLVP